MNAGGFSDDPTDQANRFALVVLALCVMFAALLGALLAWGAASGSIDRISDFAGYLRDHNGRDAKLIITLGAAVIVLLMLTLIIVEMTPSPITKMRVRDVKAGDTTITTTEIAARIEMEARTVPHVRACEATVAARGRRVDVVLDLHVDEGAGLAEAADAACRRVEALVAQTMGIDLAQRPRARLHYRELRLLDEPALPQSMRQQETAPAESMRPGMLPADGTEGTRDERARDTDPSEEAQA